jgi:hypothetical protein
MTMLELRFSRKCRDGETKIYGEVYIDEWNQRQIVNLDKSNTSLDGASGNARGSPSFTIWNGEKL